MCIPGYRTLPYVDGETGWGRDLDFNWKFPTIVQTHVQSLLKFPTCGVPGRSKSPPSSSIILIAA